MQSAMQVGVAAVLYKPFTVDNLRKTIQEVLTQMPAMPPFGV